MSAECHCFIYLFFNLLIIPLTQGGNKDLERFHSLLRADFEPRTVCCPHRANPFLKIPGTVSCLDLIGSPFAKQIRKLIILVN